MAVVDHLLRPDGSVDSLKVHCFCERLDSALPLSPRRSGIPPACEQCRRLAGGQKSYWRHAWAMPDDDHRRRLMNRLRAAINRCHSAGDPFYRHYGARGIAVCDEWRRNPAGFLLHVQSIPGWDVPALSMDRADNDLGYFPGNLRFVSRAQQMENRRSVADLHARIQRARTMLAQLKEEAESVS